MPKNSFLKAIFSGPKFSLAPIEQNNRGTLQIGNVVPVFSTILNPREGVELNMSHLVRFLPAKAPVMEGYKVTFDAFAVPFSCLGYAERQERNIDDFFNIKENAGLIENPFCFSMRQLQSIFRFGSINAEEDGSLAHAFRLGSLGDYINFPSLKNVREHVRKWLAVNPLAYGSSINDYLAENEAGTEAVPDAYLSAIRFTTLMYINDNDSLADESPLAFDMTGLGYGSYTGLVGVPFSTSESAHISQTDSPESSPFLFYSDGLGLPENFGFSGVSGAWSLLGYIVRKYPQVAKYYGFNEDYTYASPVMLHIASLIKQDATFTLDYLQVLYDTYKVDAQSIYDEYFEYIMGIILYNRSLININDELLYSFAPAGEVQETGTFLPTLGNEEPIDLSYLAAYWKIISDWYINTNIDGDPEDFFLSHCNLLVDSEYSTRPPRYIDLKPFERRWSNDIFTSAVPMAQVQNIRIPADGTIPDLREANAYQKLVDIFRNTGRRLRDVVYGVFGITPSAVRSEMSEPIGSESSWIGMQSVLQTSQTTPDSPQAAYAGIGTDSSGFKRVLKYVNNAEPTPVIIMVLMSVTQRASYMQGFDRKFFRKSIYDFAVPELAMIGEQEVTNKELYFDKDYESGVFGFNRRYYDWFYSGSEVHGDLRDSLDYWHGSRVFDSQPALNSEFIGIDSDADHLQRVFANISESARPIVYNLSFDGYKTVALPRYIQYEL